MRALPGKVSHLLLGLPIVVFCSSTIAAYLASGRNPNGQYPLLPTRTRLLQMVDRLDADAIPAQVCGNSYAALHKVVAKALFRCAQATGTCSCTS